MQCEAQSKQTGERCKRHATPGRTVCYYHGGNTPRGFGLPQTRTGRRSKDIPTRLAARYEEAVNDPELVELRSDLALIEARLCDVLVRVDTGESGQIWRRLQDTMNAFSKAERERDIDKMREYLFELRRLISRGHSDYAAWHEVSILVEQRRKLVESESKRLTLLQQFITAEQATLLIANLSSIIRTHVHDPQVLRAISSDLERMMLREQDGVTKTA